MHTYLLLSLLTAATPPAADAGVTVRYQTADARPFEVTVDYRKSLDEMIDGAGCERVGFTDLLTRDGHGFPASKLKARKSVKLVVFQMKEPATTAEVLAALEDLGLRPAQLEELLAFAAKYPDTARGIDIEPSTSRGPLVALGSRTIQRLFANDAWVPYIPCPRECLEGQDQSVRQSKMHLALTPFEDKSLAYFRPGKVEVRRWDPNARFLAAIRE